MKWSHSLAVAALTGLIGLFAAGSAANLGVTWYDVNAFEGAPGFVVAACGILGLIAGFVVGLAVSRLVARTERPSATEAAAVSAAALVVTIVAITTTARILADIPPLSEGEQLFLMVEVQTPVGYPSPDTLSGIGHLKPVGAGDPELMKRVAAHLETTMASGKYDALFHLTKAP